MEAIREKGLEVLRLSQVNYLYKHKKGIIDEYVRCRICGIMFHESLRPKGSGRRCILCNRLVSTRPKNAKYIQKNLENRRIKYY